MESQRVSEEAARKRREELARKRREMEEARKSFEKQEEERKKEKAEGLEKLAEEERKRLGVKAKEPQEAQGIYVVKSGDSLSKIAKEVYGEGKRWPEIYEANKELIGDDPNLIHPGQKLKIP